MFWHDLKLRLAEFRDDESASFMVEAVITLPLLFWTLAATYEFFEVHRYKSVREKATYTVADMLSREQSAVTETYMNNAKILFDAITNDNGTDELRVSVVRYLANTDRYEVAWSKVRGTGPMAPLTDEDVNDDRNHLPSMADGEEVIVVESDSSYKSLFSLVLSKAIPMKTRVFTSLRFAPQLCFDTCTS